MLRRFKEWRRLRADLALADAEQELRRWSFAMTPSREHRAKRRVVKAAKKVAALAGEDDAQKPPQREGDYL